jgi:4-amino-4-deoxy-L-arabinose transferase-like glycosyltransferase
MLAWIVLFIALPPGQQNFPLNDDWAFARGAFHFARGEGILYGGWASMPQLGQWAWACPFIWSFGESFFALRLATITLSWLGLWAFHDLLRRQGVTPGNSALATAVLAFNPLFFLLQGTFMTDVPALSLALLALALYVRALDTERMSWLTGAVAAAGLAGVTRQNTLAVPVVAVVLLWRMGNRRAVWWLGVLLPIVAGLATHFWFQARPDVRALRPGLLPLSDLMRLPFLVVHFCALVVLPLVTLRFSASGSWRVRVTAFVVLAIGAGCCLAFDNHLPYGGLFPYSENMLSPQGAFAGSRFTGPLIVGERPVMLNTTARGFLTLLGCLSGAELVARIVRRGRGRLFDPLVLFTLSQIPFLLIVQDLYDRYLLFLLPGAIALALPVPMTASEYERRRPLLAGWAMTALVGACSLGLAHDWLAWNSARWELGRRALARKVPPEAIEGGVEWNGWFVGLSNQSGDLPPGPRWHVLRFTHDWFPSVVGRFALSFSEKPAGLNVRHARTVDREPYSSWLLPRRSEFYLIETPPILRRTSRSQAGGS